MKKRGEKKKPPPLFFPFSLTGESRVATPPPHSAPRAPRLPVPGTGERVAGEGARQADPAIRASSSRADAPHRWDFLESARSQIQGGGGATSRYIAVLGLERHARGERSLGQTRARARGVPAEPRESALSSVASSDPCEP